MIRLHDVSFRYPGAEGAALAGIDLEVADGDLLLVAGASGSGKSTLLRVPTGLVPHHSGGTLSGRVSVAGRNVTGLPPRELAGTIGFVPQDPEAHATTDRVIGELAFAMENLGVPRVTMRRRIEEVLDALGIAHLRERKLDTLSGGERQRVAIAAVLTAQPQVLVLDEPTSALDPQSAEDVFSVLSRLRDELGLTIVCAEHRLERVASFTDRVFFFDPVPPRSGGGSGVALEGTPREVFAHSSYAPPVSVIGRRLGWQPLPVTVREGRRFGVPLELPVPTSAPRTARDAVMRVDKVRIAVGGREVVRGVSLELQRGEIAALLGRNGAGKTTLLRGLAGLTKPDGGTISLGDDVVDGRRAQRDASKRVAYVPQRAEMLLFRDTVGAELGDEEWLRRLGLFAYADRHPWTLSAGQRLWAALGTAFVRSPDVYLLDEPTRGLDPPGKDLLARILREKTDEGAAVLLVTHDVELVARAADRVHLMAEGDIVASGPVRDVLGESLLFSSQTAKVMGDPHFLVPDDVFHAIERSDPGGVRGGAVLPPGTGGVRGGAVLPPRSNDWPTSSSAREGNP